LSGKFLAASATLLLVVNAVALWHWRSSEVRYLIVHADDAGMNSHVNAATIDAMDQGVVTSASIMVPCAGFAEFAQFAASRPNFDFGVHLTLTCDVDSFRWGPVLPAGEVPSLVDGEGKFFRTVDEVARSANVAEVRRELDAQIDRAVMAGVRVSHLDHHMFVLCARPDFFELYVAVGIERNLPVRIQKTPPFEDVVSRGQAMTESFARNRDRAADHGLRILDFIETENYFVPPSEKQQYYLTQLRRLPPGVSELVVHCAYDRGDGPPTPHASRREADTRAMMSPQIKSEIERLGIRLTNHRRQRG
jgi:predicted glycoside hydrolase/deacetylase ChbG (UPF0249 family)